MLENDADVHLLLQLTAVMGGSCTATAVKTVWAALHGSAEGAGPQAQDSGQVLERALRLRFLKLISSSGTLSGTRRRSSAANRESRFIFCHLKIFDSVKDAMLQGQTRRLHALYAHTLSDKDIEPMVLATHYELGGLHWEAAKLYYRCQQSLKQEGAGFGPQGAVLSKVS